MANNIDIDEIVCNFLHALKQKGYSVGTDAYIKTTELFRWFLQQKKATSLSSFAAYLSPFICKNEEEQHNFKKIFDESFLPAFDGLEEELRMAEDEKIKAATNIKKQRQKKWSRITIIAALLLAAGLTALWYFTPREKVILDFSKISKEPQYFNKNNQTVLTHTQLFNNVADTAEFEVEYNFRQSHTIKKGNSVTHNFPHYGKDTFSVSLRSKLYNIDTTIIYPEIYVGPENKPLITAEKNELEAGEANTFTATIDTSIHEDFYWEVAKTIDTVPAKKYLTGNPLKYDFKDTGEYIISVKYDTRRDSFLQKFPAAFTSASYVQKVMPPGLQLTSTYQPPPPIIDASVNKIWIAALAALALLLLYTCYRIVNKKTSVAADNFKGDGPPYDLHFTSREQDIAAGYNLLRLSSDLRKRVESRNTSFDISKTIKQTILNRGFITPGFVQKQTNREYLFLIDQAYTNSQQMKLFGYLARYFINHQVKLDFYFYHQTPDKFYKEVDGPRTPLENLKDRYYNSALVVFADGANFIDYEIAKIKDKTAAAFTYWPSRVLVTPVPFNDWAKNEKILAAFFNLLPADINGLLELVRAMDTDTSEKTILGRFYTYEAKYVDFSSMDSLKEYLADEELFQWVCAQAVHPKIYWDIIIETGKAIVQDKNKVNYDTLLKLARIRWIAEGSFPPAVRLALLKQLNEKNELKTRELLLAMLEEMPASEAAFSYEEKQLSRYTNGFVLYSTGMEKYRSDIKMQVAEEKFIALYKSQQITDNPFRIYAEKKETPTDQWDTLTVTGNHNTGIDEYIKEKDRVLKGERLQRLRSAGGLLAIAAVLLLGIGYLFYGKDAIARSSINQYLHLADTSMAVNNNLLIKIGAGQCLHEMLSAAGDSTVTIEVSSDGKLISSDKLKFSDTGLASMNYKGLQYDSTKNIQCRLIFTNNHTLERTLPFVPGIYNITIVGCSKQSVLDSGKVLYYRGANEDTTAVYSSFANSRYTINVIAPAYSNANAAAIPGDANYALFDSATGKNEMYAIAQRLTGAGFPLKNIGIDYSAGNRRNIIIKRVDSINSWPIISNTTLRCLLFNEGCNTTINNPASRSLVQILFSNPTSADKVKQLRACINSSSMFNSNTASQAAGAPRNQVWYFRDSYRDTVTMLLTCLKTYFPDRQFTVVKRAVVPATNAAAEIYLFDSIATARPTVAINISNERLRPGVNSIRDELVKNGLSASNAQVNSYISSNTITYSDNSLRDEAVKVKAVYEKYFKGIPITVSYAADAARRRIITLSVTQNRTVPPTEMLNVTGLGMKTTIEENEDFVMSLSITSLVSNSSAPQQLEGNICLAGEVMQQVQQQSQPGKACDKFSFSKNGASNAAIRINTAGLKPGRYNLTLTTALPHKDTTLAYITIEAAGSQGSCDTVYSNLRQDSVNVLLRRNDIRLSVKENNPKSTVITLSSGKCPLNDVRLIMGEKQKLQLCDGTEYTITVSQRRNINLKNSAITYQVILCKVTAKAAVKAK